MAVLHRIGLQIDVIDSGYARALIAGVSSFYRERGIDLVIFSGRAQGWPHGFEYQNSAIFSHINQRNIDALIVASGTQGNYIKHDEFLANLRLLYPLPIVSLSLKIPGIPSIVADNSSGFMGLLGHLKECHACDRIALISGPEDNPDTWFRRKIYESFLERYQIPKSASLILAGDFSDRSGYEAVKKFLASAQDLPDAFVAMNDMMAAGALKCLAENSIKVPQDVIVTGFDNIDRSRFMSPSLTTVCQNLHMQSRKAAEYALTLANGSSIPEVTEVPTQVLYRQSCGCVSLNDRQAEAIDVNGGNIITPENSEAFFAYGRFQIEDDLLQLRQYLGHLYTIQTISDLVMNLQSDLEFFRVKTCAICLFTDKIVHDRQGKFVLPEKAELILAYDESTGQDTSDKRERIPFNPRVRMIPEGLFSARPRMLVATALYHRETQLGYIVYEPGEIASSIYETLCVQISKSISSALVFTEKVELENELNSALNKLEVINGELHDISRTDELTGLLNRRGFLSLGQQSINLSLGMGKKGLVIFGDLDGLKAINDTWGHDVGDRALKAIAEILRRTFRSADVLARLSGDEFVVVTIDADSGSMETFNRRIEDLLRDWNQNSGEPYRLSISIGAVEYSQDSADLTKLLLFADGLLYEKKNAKKTIR